MNAGIHTTHLLRRNCAPNKLQTGNDIDQATHISREDESRGRREEADERGRDERVAVPFDEEEECGKVVACVPECAAYQTYATERAVELET